MPKSTKRFILSNSDLNMHGFRVLTEGVDLSEFEKNPVMLWMHVRSDGSPEKLPIGYWDELKLEGDNITGIPNFDDNDPLAMKIYHKVEHGTIRAASAGVLPVKLSSDPTDMLPGQTLPSFKKSKFKEASLCDIGSNAGAVSLYDKTGKLVTLSAGGFTDHFEDLLTPISPMKLTTLNAPMIFALLKLDPEKATEAEALAEVQKIITQAAEKETKVTELAAEIVALKKNATAGQINLMVDKAITERKILAGQKETYVKLAAADFTTTEALLKSLPGSVSVKDKLADTIGEDNSCEVGKLMKLEYNELFANGGLTKLKALDMESYNQKFKERYGYLPGEKK